MKTLKEIFNKIKKYIIIIGSIVMTITIFILGVMGYKKISKIKLNNKEKELKDSFDNLKEKEKEVKQNVKNIKNKRDTIIDDINNITDKLTGD